MNTSKIIKTVSVFVCVCICLICFAGCKKTDKDDKYYWRSNWEEEQVPVTVTVEDDEDTLIPVSPSDEVPSNVKSTEPAKQKEAVYDASATVDPCDKPAVKNTACLINPMVTASDSAANARRDAVLSSSSSAPNVSGKIYYISYKGDDNNDGLSPTSPWKSLTKLSYALQIGENDAVLFERGGVYRGHIQCKSGVYYGAFGTGDKPCIYGSSKNYAKTQWTADSANIWVAPSNLSDVGIIVFNHGEAAGHRKFSKSELKANGDYYSAEGGKVYLYMDAQPAEKYTSIEMGADNHIFSIPSGSAGITIDNLTIKYTGAMGIQGSKDISAITITNCEIGWCGGSVLNGYGDGNVRYGNGIEFWQGCEGITVDNCWIYQIYDSGFTHQGNSGKFTVKNLKLTNSLIEYTGFAAVEYWAPAENSHKMVNIEYSNNILRFGGYCWDANPSSQPAALIYTTDNYNEFDNFVIKNNILDTSVKRMVRCIHQYGKLPVMSGNTFIGKKGDMLGMFATSNKGTDLVLGDTSKSDIASLWGDTVATVIFNG